MRRKHRRRHQGRLSRLASLARSLTASSAAGLLLALATLLVITPAQGNAQSATYRVTFQGKWTTSVTSGGLPSGAHFSPLIGAVHNDSVTFWSSGGTASAGVESMAEVGGTSALKSEINAAGSEASSTIERSGTVGATATVTVDITVSPTHPLVTLVTMIAPSPDWFVGVSGLSLLNAQNEWLASHTVDLFPYDAGTEDGTEFSLNNDATDPQGTITSIKGMGQFSSAPIATLTFTRQSVNTAPSFTSDTSFEVDENQTAAATVVAEDPDSVDEVAYAITGGADALKFDIGETTGVLTFKIPPNYESRGGCRQHRSPQRRGKQRVRRDRDGHRRHGWAGADVRADNHRHRAQPGRSRNGQLLPGRGCHQGDVERSRWRCEQQELAMGPVFGAKHGMDEHRRRHLGQLHAGQRR